MAVIQDPTTAANLSRVEATGCQRTTIGMIGDRYSQATVTATISAGLGANAAVFCMRLNPGTSKRVRIHRVRLQWTTIVAFTTPITAGRRLVICRGVGAAASGGTAVGAANKKDTTSGTTQCDSTQGGDTRVSSGAALTVTGITFESGWSMISLTHVGAAGAYLEHISDFYDTMGGPPILAPGELLAVRCGTSAMDAAGTWTLGIIVDYTEIDNLA